MEKGIVPHPGIDTDARWGFSHTNEAGYLDLNYTWFQVIVIPLSADDITTANVG